MSRTDFGNQARSQPASFFSLDMRFDFILTQQIRANGGAILLKARGSEDGQAGQRGAGDRRVILLHFAPVS